MNILLVSDSHGNETHLKKALMRHKEMDALIHLGDFEGSRGYIEQLARTTAQLRRNLPIYMVTGNCDFSHAGGIPSERVETLGGYRMLLTHGHRYGVSGGDLSRLAYRAEEQQCDIVCFGHIHQPVTRIIPGRGTSGRDLLILNPGSISRPRQEGWQPTCMLLELEEGSKPSVSLEYF